MDLKEKNLASAKITSKNQITIPKEVRDKLGVTVHDELVFEYDNQKNFIVKKKKQPNDFWEIVAAQEVKYGSVEAPAVEWGEDVGSEVID